MMSSTCPTFKVVNLDTGSPFFFNEKTDTVFVPPLAQVKRFLKRNSAKRYAVYVESTKPRYVKNGKDVFPRWMTLDKSQL